MSFVAWLMRTSLRYGVHGHIGEFPFLLVYRLHNHDDYDDGEPVSYTHLHVSPDPDALGSQLGLAALIHENYPEKFVKTVGFTEPSLAWMGVMDEVKDEEYELSLIHI